MRAHHRLLPFAYQLNEQNRIIHHRSRCAVRDAAHLSAADPSTDRFAIGHAVRACSLLIDISIQLSQIRLHISINYTIIVCKWPTCSIIGICKCLYSHFSIRAESLDLQKARCACVCVCSAHSWITSLECMEFA